MELAKELTNLKNNPEITYSHNGDMIWDDFYGYIVDDIRNHALY